MDTITILKVYGECYESRPCKHRCDVLCADKKVTKLVSGPEIARHPETFKDDILLLEHFAEYNSGIKEYIDVRWLATSVVREELSNLYTTNSPIRESEILDQTLKMIDEIKSMHNSLKEGLRRGYDGVRFPCEGCALLNDNSIHEVLAKVTSKLAKEGLRDVTMVSFRGDTLDIYLDLTRMKLAAPYKMTLVPCVIEDTP